LPITIRYIKRESASPKKPTAPVTIEWKGERMIRNHSLRAAVREIIKMSSSLDVVKVNIIGIPASGKTTLAGTIAHLVHKMAEIPYAVKLLNKDNLLNFQETLKNLTPTNYVLIFDDVSFLGANANKKQIEIVKQAFTEIRHLEGGQDVKIIAIFNFHYTRALDKYLRQCEFSFYTSIGSSEFENMQQMLGVKNTPKLELFRRIWQQAYTRDKFTFQLGRKKFFSYSMRKPFIPLLFSNGYSVRFVVSPKREWIDPICSTCAAIDDKVEFNSLEEFVNDFSKKFTIGNAKAAVKIKLFQNGINGYSKRVKQAMKYIDQCLEQNNFNLEDLALAYDLNIKKTKLFPDKQPD
jgi:nicotinamide riboside kinase